jgi:hypothetical protein
VRDTRRFVESRLRDLQSLFAAEPVTARAEIAKHVQKITLTSDGRKFGAAGEWDLLGSVAARMVPGARIAPRVRIVLACLWREVTPIDLSHTFQLRLAIEEAHGLCRMLNTGSGVDELRELIAVPPPTERSLRAFAKANPYEAL